MAPRVIRVKTQTMITQAAHACVCDPQGEGDALLQSGITIHIEEPVQHSSTTTPRGGEFSLSPLLKMKTDLKK